MKRIISFVFAFFLMLQNVYAETDITFMNIPWLSNESITFQTLKEAGYICNDTLRPNLSNDNTVYLIEDDDGFVVPHNIGSYASISFLAELTGIAKGKIAGFPVKNLKLSFAYDGEYKLIAVIVELINADYKTLKNKLTKKYGEGKCLVSEEIVESNIWKGSNNSAVLLYTQSEGRDYSLVYGRLDAIEILTNCLVSNPDDISGL